MRKFYLCYPIFQTVSEKLSWSHICELITIDDELERSFYEKECIASQSQYAFGKYFQMFHFHNADLVKQVGQYFISFLLAEDMEI